MKVRGQSQKAKDDALTEVPAGPGDEGKAEGGAVEKRDRIEQTEPMRIGGKVEARRWLAEGAVMLGERQAVVSQGLVDPSTADGPGSKTVIHE